MVAQITRFYSRAELGMRAPKSVSRNITPEQGGVAGHYGGGGPNPAPTTFAAAAAIWRGWQDFHMDGRNWADIAYSAGFDNLGNVYAGRGLGVRTAANGSNYGNDDYYAFVWIGGGSAMPTEKAFDAFEWLTHYARTKGNAGMRVRPHMAFTDTACPGTAIRNALVALDNKAILLPAAPTVPVVTKPTTRLRWSKSDVVAMQGIIRVSKDGSWGADTDFSAGALRAVAADGVAHTRRQVEEVQRQRGLTKDGSLGPKTRAAVKAVVDDMQRILKVSPDQNWGPGTDRAYLAFHKEWRGR